MSTLKFDVKQYWNKASCGEELYLEKADREGYASQSERRYLLEPYIEPFANFQDYKKKKVLEVGVGLGADHQKFAEAGALCFGVDMTPRSVEHTERRLALFGLQSQLSVGDAEYLEFPDKTFDCVYSWGVLHHSPNTQEAIHEVHRVLRPGGKSLIMMYHKWSLVGFMLWLRYGFLRLRPFISLKDVYHNYLESPGTKAYSKEEAHKMFSLFTHVEINTVLTHGDLLEGGAGQRHEGFLINVARAIWPRRLIKLILPRAGLFMLIEATK